MRAGASWVEASPWGACSKAPWTARGRWDLVMLKCGVKVIRSVPGATPLGMASEVRYVPEHVLRCQLKERAKTQEN